MMTVTGLLDIPENDQEIQHWLEGLLVSKDFGAAIAQLAWLNSAAPSSVEAYGEIAELSDSEVASIVENGLSVVSDARCRALLRRPERLIELNHKIYELGAPYWMKQIRQSAETESFLADFASQNFAEESQASQPAQSQQERTQRHQPPSQKGFSRRQLLSMAASVAVVALGVWFFNGSGDGDKWGWQTVASFPQNVSAAQYFQTTSDSVLQWYEQPAHSPAALTASLNGLAKGCQQLIAAPHQPLGDADRDWLIEKCTAWQTTIDQLHASAQQLKPNNNQGAAQLKNRADDLVSKIAKVLSDRAKAV